MAYHLLETPLNDTQTVEELDNDKLRIKARIPDTLQFEQWLKSFGSDVEILKPIKLRIKFIEMSKELNKIYHELKEKGLIMMTILVLFAGICIGFLFCIAFIFLFPKFAQPILIDSSIS